MFKPLVTVMVPTYNQDKYIEKALDSILNQTYTNIEIIVSDDSSNNLTENIINTKYYNKVIYYRNIPPLGRVNNYRKLLYKRVNGDWAINLDGDDFFDDNCFIEKACDLIGKYPDVVLLFSKQYIYADGQKKVKYAKKLPEFFKGEDLVFKTIFSKIEIPHLGTLYNVSKAREIGFYEYDILSSDRESLLKLCMGNNVAFLDIFSGCWNHHGGNASQAASINQILDNIKMYDRLFFFFVNKKKRNCVKFYIWKIFAKYIEVSGIIKTNIKFNEVQKKDLITIFKQEKLIFFLLFIDPRIYKAVLLKVFRSKFIES